MILRQNHRCVGFAQSWFHLSIWGIREHAIFVGRINTERYNG